MSDKADNTTQKTPSLQNLMDLYKTKAKTFSALIVGGAGSGKTECITTLLLQPNHRVAFIGLDKNGMRGLIGGMKTYNIDTSIDFNRLCFWDLTKDLEANNNRLESMILYHSEVATRPWKQIIDEEDTLKGRQQGFLSLLSTLENFKDSYTNNSFGNDNEWNINTTLVLDSLTSLVTIIRLHLLGNKAVMSSPSRGAIQQYLINFLSYLLDLNCNVVVLAHPKEKFLNKDKSDEYSEWLVKTTGIALDRVIPSMFSDPIFMENFKWHGAHEQFKATPRNIPQENNLIPNFAFSHYGFFK